MLVNTKQTSRLILASLFASLITSCTWSEQPGKTADGVQPSGRNEDTSWFDQNKQISKEVVHGELHDEVNVDRSLSSSPTNSADLSGTTARDNNSWNFDRMSNSAVGSAQEPGSNFASKASLHAADGSSSVVAGGNSVNSVAVDADRKLRAKNAKKSLKKEIGSEVEMDRAPASIEDLKHPTNTKTY